MTYSLPPDAYRTLQPERVGRKVKVWDVALSVVLLVLLTLFTLGVSYAGFFLAMVSDMCAGSCDMGMLNFGVWFAIIAPWVVLLLAVVASIVLLVLHRLAFWVPLAAAAIMIGTFFVGMAIAGAAVQR